LRMPSTTPLAVTFAVPLMVKFAAAPLFWRPY
jgi:hypothetical protein